VSTSQQEYCKPVDGMVAIWLEWRSADGPFTGMAMAGGDQGYGTNVAPPGRLPVITKRCPDHAIIFQSYAGSARKLWIYPNRLVRAKRRDLFIHAHRTLVREKRVKPLTGCAYYRA